MLCTLAGACLWGIVWIPIKVLEGLGVTGLWTTFWVYSLITVVSLPLLIREYLKSRISWQWGPIGIVLIFGGLTNFFFFLSLANTTVVRALMFFYLSPVWNLLAGRIIFGQALTVKKIAVVCVALLGAFVLLGLYRSSLFFWNAGDTLALCSGLCFSVSVFGMKKSPATPGWALAAVNWLGTALFALATILILGTQPPSASNISQWLPLLFVLAFFLQGIASLLIIFSLTRLAVYRVNILMLFELIAGAVSFAVWNALTIPFHEWLGIGLIITASLADNLSSPLRLFGHGPLERK